MENIGRGNSMNNGKKQDISGSVLEIRSITVCWNTEALGGEARRMGWGKSGDCSHLRVFSRD